MYYMYMYTHMYVYVYNIGTSGSWPTGTAAPILRLFEAALEQNWTIRSVRIR